MKKDEQKETTAGKKKLVLRKESIRRLDERELSLVVGGMDPPDDLTEHHPTTGG